MIKRTVFIILAIAVIGIGVFAYTGAHSEKPFTVPSGAKAGELVGLETCTYHDYSADCGTLVVPENRGDPASRLIALPVIRVRATSSDVKEPIFWLFGGPGQSNMEFKAVGLLNEHHDVVIVGYRGIDGYPVLDCPETVSALKSVDDFLTDAALDSFSASISQCAERLQEESVDLKGYTLLERVDDLEAARTALGYERINIVSQSVGTRTAMIYVQKYPDVINRLVMIAVNPPGHLLWKADVTDQQLAYYSTLCAKDPDCSARTDNLAETIRTVSRNLPDHWLFIPIHSGNVRLATLFGLFHTSKAPFSAPYILDAWLAAADGDFSGLAMLSFFADQVFPSSFVWGETAATGTSTDVDVARDYLAEGDHSETILGAPGTVWLWGGLGSWPENLIPEEYHQVHPSDVETLLVGGSVDLSISPQFARDEVLPLLSHGQQVILSEYGHSDDVWKLQPEATGRMLTSFYDTGVPDTSLFKYQPASFDVSVGFPEMAKITLGVLAIVVTLILLFLVRRLLS